MKRILTALIFFISTTVVGERIDGPANIRQSIKGEIIFSLNDNIEVNLGALQNDWYELVVSVTLVQKQYDDGIIKKGEKLFSGNGKEIGVAVTDVRLSSLYTGGGATGVPKWYGAEIHGYTFKSNIRPESIVEPVISKLIESNMDRLTLQTFEEHMRYFGYVDGLKIKDMDQYKTYMIYESKVDDISPLDRIRLIFEGDQLIAVVHSRDLTLRNFSPIPIERERKLTLIKTFFSDEKEIFIEKNKQSYWGVD
jgi:hypothetical protein